MKFRFDIFKKKNVFCKNCKYAIIRPINIDIKLYCVNEFANASNIKYLAAFNSEEHLFSCNYARSAFNSCSQKGKYFEKVDN